MRNSTHFEIVDHLGLSHYESSFQGPHCTGKTENGNKISLLVKHREFRNFAKTQNFDKIISLILKIIALLL